MRLTAQEGERLLLHGDPVELGRQADAVRRRRFGDTVTFIIDRNINYTNVCENECRFCAFFRRKGQKDAYLLSEKEILQKVRETVEAGGTQVMIQGGLHPDLGLDYYERMLRSIRRAFPSITIHSFTATEIQYFARRAGLSIMDTLKRLQDAGLASLPGGGAEILVDDVRRRVSPKKIMTEDWLHVMECAHSIGMKSTATMVIGLGGDDEPAHRAYGTDSPPSGQDGRIPGVYHLDVSAGPYRNGRREDEQLGLYENAGDDAPVHG